MTSNQIHTDYHTVRRLPRLKGEIPVILDQGSGVTKDYNTAGVYFLTEGTYFPGETVSFTLLMNHQLAGQQMRVKCQGTVVRTSLEESRLGVAVELNAHAFVP